MRTRFDQLSKGVFGRVGERLGRVHTQYEIPGEVQAADLVFWPDGARTAEGRGLGLIGRMLAGPCMLESFHDTPSVQETRDCLSKLPEGAGGAGPAAGGRLGGEGGTAHAACLSHRSCPRSG